MRIKIYGRVVNKDNDRKGEFAVIETDHLRLTTMTDPDAILYEHWTGECREDPSIGNSYVMRSVERLNTGQMMIHVNDVFGGHAATIALEEWLTWKLCPEETTE